VPSDLPAPVLGPVESWKAKRDQIFWRIHRRDREAIFFGRSRLYRFDDPHGEFGVLYAALGEECAFLETLVRVPQSEGRVLRSELARRSISPLTASRPLRFADLRGHHLAQLRVDSRLFAYTDYTITQPWARALFEHEDEFDGLVFHSRHNPELHAVAVFDRAERELKAGAALPLDGETFRPRLEALVERYRLALL
jgi:hypothetical protein